MLNVSHVTKKFGKTVANNDISFSVDSGQIAILLGPNGAGKTTIIKSIAGLLRFEGKITVCGYDSKSVGAKQNLGYIPELPAVYDLLTVGEHMEFMRRAWKLPPDNGFENTLLERLELDDKRGKTGKELSKGMKQKLSIACALIHKPRVIIFDEPLVGLDPHAIKELKQMFRELKEQGCAVLISTHMLDSVEDYWDVAHIMVSGAFAATKRNTPEETDSQSLESLFFEITEGGTPKTASDEKTTDETAIRGESGDE